MIYKSPSYDSINMGFDVAWYKSAHKFKSALEIYLDWNML